MVKHVRKLAALLEVSKTTVFIILRDYLDMTKITARWVTRSETWIHHYESESKQESMQWHVKSSRSPKNFKVTLFARKNISEESRNFSHWIFISKGSTIAGEYYVNLLHFLRIAIEVKRPWKPPEGFFCSMTMYQCTSCYV